MKSITLGRFGHVWSGQLRLSEPSIRTKLQQASVDLSRIMHCEDDDDSGSLPVAIKIFAENDYKSWETELLIFRIPNLSHPNILRFIGSAARVMEPTLQGGE